jgi:serine/threonine protein kinase
MARTRARTPGTVHAPDGCVEFSPGDRIGNYRIEGELGTTGPGLLLQAQHVVLPRRAIIKVLRAAFATVQPYLVQMLREAWVLEAVAHPGVPIVYESGLLLDRRPWLALETSSGRTLDSLLAFGAFPLIEVAALLRDLSEILDHAHHRGVIYRGLRPERILISASARYPVCIPDWSEALVHDAANLVRLVVPEGLRSYVAPELLRECAGSTGELIEGGVDVFALGVIAHRALTGSLPYAPGLGTEPYAPSLDRRPDAPRELAEIIDAMLAFDPFDRPSACEVRVHIERLLATVPELQARAAGSEWPEASAPDDERADRSSQPRPRAPRWTPDAPYVETPELTDVDTIEDDVTA